MAYKEKTYPIETVCVGYFDTGKRYKDGPLKGKRIWEKVSETSVVTMTNWSTVRKKAYDTAKSYKNDPDGVKYYSKFKPQKSRLVSETCTDSKQGIRTIYYHRPVVKKIENI